MKPGEERVLVEIQWGEVINERGFRPPSLCQERGTC